MQSELMEIGGILMPRRQIKKLAQFLRGNSQGLIYGDPGQGKTFQIKSVLPSIHQQIFGRACILIVADLYLLKVIRDGIVDFDFKNNNLVKKLSEFARSIQEAIDNGLDFHILIDELDKIALRDQSQFLSLMEINGSNYLSVPELGIEIQIPESTKVIGIANYLSDGTFEISKPLRDRLKIMQWQVPAPDEAVPILASKFKDFKPQSLQIFNAIDLLQKPIDADIISTIVEIAYQLHQDEGQPYSYRHLIRLINTYINEDCDDLLVDFGLVKDNEYKNSFYRYEYLIKSKIYAAS